MSFLSRWSLANRGLVALITLVLAGFAAYATPNLKQQLIPSLSFPMVSIVAAYPGAAPDIVESEVVDPLEDALRGVKGVTQTSSSSSESNANVRVLFDFGVDIDDAQAKVQQAIAKAKLPDGVDPQTIVGSTDDLPIIQLAASSTVDEQTLAAMLGDQVVPKLQGIEGVKEASVSGARERVVTITADPAELAAKGLTPQAISAAVQGAGKPFPVGSVTENGNLLTIQAGDAYAAIEDLRNLYLTPAAAQPGQNSGAQNPAKPGNAAAPAEPVRLGDVAEVTLDSTEATSLTRTNGTPSLGVSITAAPDGNAVAISEDVRAQLPELLAALGSGAALTVVSDQAPAIEQAIDNLTTEGLLGLAMAVLVILVFLLSVRSTLVTAVSIPLSVLIALIALWTQDYSLNMLTLGALTIAIGRVVDDAIVVLENIKRHLSYGEDRRTAVLTGVREVSGAVTSSTLTTVAVFLPIAFVGGLIGELFGPFSVTVAVALLASLLVSLTVVPVLAYWFLKPPKKQLPREAVEARERNGILQRAYVPVLRFATRHRITTVAIALLILVGTMSLVPRLKTSFIDDAGQKTVTMEQKFPAGTALETVDAKAKEIEGMIAAIDDVEMYQATMSTGGGMRAIFFGGSTPSAQYTITLKDGGDITAVQDRLRTQIEARSDLGEVTVGESGGFGGDALQVKVTAEDPAVLAAAAQQVQDAMGAVPGVTEVKSTIADTVPRVEISVDRKAAAARGLSETAIAGLVTQAVQGSTLTQVTFDGTTADVVLRTGTAPASIEDLRALPIPGGILDDVADVEIADGPSTLRHDDGARTATVSGTNTGESLGTTTQELTKKLDALTLPAGATWEIGGASSDQAEAFRNLGLALVAAIALVFIVMVATFRSLIQPLILLVSIPFAATGAIGLLLATDTSLGLAAMIGLLMLVGIVVTNAIVLLDLINLYRRQGMPLAEAVIEGGRNRLRPILMTALATIFALLPMAFGITGGGGFISKPLAVVVIGGLVSSTLLTLVLVPTLYTMVERRKENRAAKKDAKRARKQGNTPAEGGSGSADELDLAGSAV